MVKKCRKSSEVILANGVQKFSFVDVMIYIILGLLVVTMVVPFMNIISISLSDYTSVVSDKTMLIPKNLNFSAYKIIFNVEVYRAFFLTAFVTVANTTLHIILCMMAAYPLAKKELPGRKVMFIYVLFTMLFSGGTIPFYILVRDLGLTDNVLVYILPGVVGAYTVVLMKNFIGQIPKSLEEAALTDGANYLYILFKIIFPLAKHIIATMALFNAVGVWNNWFTAELFVKDKNLYLIQNVLREMLIEGNMAAFGQTNLMQTFDDSVKMAAIIVSIIPIVAIYPFVQRYFTKGLYLGSVKE